MNSRKQHRLPIKPTLWLVLILGLSFMTGCEQPQEDDGTLHTFAFSGRITGGTHSDIFLIGEDGEGLRNVPGDNADEIMPKFHPEDMKVYFLSDREDGDYDLYYTDSIGQDVTAVTSGFDIRNFNFSPNGEWITFQTLPDGSPSYIVYRVRDDGTALEQLVTHAGNPDYRSSNYIWYSNYDDSGIMYSLNLSTSETEAITSAPLTTHIADYSSDRKVFLLQIHYLSGQSAWQLVDSDANPVLTLTMSQTATHGDVNLSDSDELVTWSEYVGSYTQIQVADKNLRDVVELTDDTFRKLNPEYYHDDFRVAYLAYDDEAGIGYIYTVPAEGGDITRITAGYENLHTTFSISPDFWQ